MESCCSFGPLFFHSIMFLLTRALKSEEMQVAFEIKETNKHRLWLYRIWATLSYSHIIYELRRRPNRQFGIIDLACHIDTILM